MARQKLVQYAHNFMVENILQEGKELYANIRGKWNELFFKNNNPIVAELGCGRGEYTTGLAQHFPDKNFVGVDIKGNRLWKGSVDALENNLTNVGFLRTYINNLDYFFDANELSEIWITFPDPRPKGYDRHRRLTSAKFMTMYQKILNPNGIVHLKTDSEPLFENTLEVLEDFDIRNMIYTKDLYNSDLNNLHYNICTTYETKFTKLGYQICYLQFQFKN